MTQQLTPREVATSMERGTALPAGVDERFTGYGVIGLPFASGHYLAFRDFVASSIGPAYRSVWHRDPTGAWTVYSSTPPEQSCSRYIGAVMANPPVTTPVDVTWLADAQVRIRVDDVIDWTLQMAETPATRLMTAMGQHLPATAWTNRAVLGVMGRMAGPMLSAGRMRLTGDMPNGHDFRAAPRRIWAIPSGAATVSGRDIGAIGPLVKQDRLGGFWLPQRGLFLPTAWGDLRQRDLDMFEQMFEHE